MRIRIGLFLVILLAAAVRLYGLDAKALWFDETLSWRLQSFPLPMLVERTGSPATVHPPLYFVALRGWTRGFGDSVFSLRLASTLFGVLSVWAIYGLTRDLAAMSLGREPERSRCRAAGLLAACLVAVSPYHIHAAHQVRPYTLGILLAVFSTWLLVCALNARTRRGMISGWLFYALTAVAFCYTHNLALFSLVAQGLYAGAVLVAGRGQEQSGSEAAAARGSASRRWALLAAGLVVLCYLPWLPKAFAQSENMRTAWTRALSASDLVRQPATALLAAADSLPEESLVFAAGTVGVLLAVLAVAPLLGGRAGALVLLMGLVPLLLILLYSTQSTRMIFSPRYFAFAQPFWLVAFSMIACRPADRPLRYALAALGLFWSVAACAEHWDILGRKHQPGMPAAVEQILAQRRSDEPVVAETVETFLKLLYYSDGSFRPWLYSQSAEPLYLSWAPQLVDEDFGTSDQLLAAEPGGVWVVSSGFYGHLPSSRVSLPEGFERRQVATFDQDMHWERRIEVRHFRRQ